MTTTIQSAATTLREPGVEFEFDEVQLAVSFLARCSGRTLEAYRHDLRGFFQWATDNRIFVLGANRAHIELFRAWMEDRGLAASTIDRRLSTVLGSTGSRTSTDVSARTPPSTSADRRSIPRTLGRWIARSSGCSCSPRSSATEITPRLACCWG